jgi:hypothetical protein
LKHAINKFKQEQVLEPKTLLDLLVSLLVALYCLPSLQDMVASAA